QLVAARARDRNRHALSCGSGNKVTVDTVDRWLIQGRSDLPDLISNVCAAHDDTRVIGTEETSSTLCMIGLVDVFAFGFEAHGESLEPRAARVLRHQRDEQ